MNRAHGLASVSTTLGYGLIALGGGTLNGVAFVRAPLADLGIVHGVAPLLGWVGIVVGLLLTQPRLHALARVEPRAGTPRARAWPAPLSSPPRKAGHGIAFVVRQVAIAFLLRWAVGGLAFWAALPLLAYSHARLEGAKNGRQWLELQLLYLLFYGYGVGGLWNFVGHYFMADMVAASVGWPAGSPFQQELGFYALGTGAVGLMTPWWRDRFWVAAAMAPSIFVYGAAFTHIEDYLVNGNVAPANWSIAAVGANLVIPTVVLSMTWAYSRAGGFVRGGG